MAKSFKKFLTVNVLMLLTIFLLFSLTACPSEKVEIVKTKGNEELPVLKTSSDIPQINGSDVIYVVNPSKTKSITGKSKLSPAETAMLVSLQGIVAQTRAEIYIGKEDDILLQYIVNNYGKSTEILDDMSAILDKYQDQITDKGYVRVKYSETAITTSLLNQASTLASANKWLIVPVNKNTDDPLEKALNEKGFLMKKDYFLASADSEAKIIEENKNNLNTKVLASISPATYISRDYGIAVKAPFYFHRSSGSSEDLNKIYGMLSPLASVIGWQDVVQKTADGSQSTQYGVQIDQWPELTSDFGLVALPTTDIHNLSLYASIKQEGNLQQKQTKSNAGENVHYVTVIYNNGEDMGYFLDFIKDSKMFANTDKSENPVGWTINPSLYDYIPMAMRYAYENMTDNEYFVASPVGFGRVNLSLLEEHGKPYGTTLQAYLDRTNDILGKTGLPYITYLGNLNDKTNKNKTSVIELLGKLSNVKGGFVLTADNVSPTGGIKWIDGKPFVADREIIRDYNLHSREQQKALIDLKVKDGRGKFTPPTMAKIVSKVTERLAQYDVNPSSIEGYSVVQVDSAYNYKDLVKNFYEKIDTNKIRVVTPDEFMKLIEQNITDKQDVSSVKILSTEKEEAEE